MTYQDPDPLRDPDFDRKARIDREYGSNAMWGWIAGAVVAVLALVFLFGSSNKDSTSTAGMNPQPSASAPVINTPPANNTANAPRATPAPAETTGQNPPPAPQQ
jgi:hypothetical protein